METPPPLAGLDPADLLRQGAADETVVDGVSSAFQPPAMEEIAAAFPQFEILELIGQGGMGAVYKVRQKDLDRVVALKILPPAIGQSPEFSERFTREARALAKLNHPGIVTIHEFGQKDGLYFILMEFVDGVNLAQLMKTGRVSPREALAIVPQICDALQYAHDQGIVHRDIKPENLLLDRSGRVKVADFGIAKVVASVCDRRTNEDDDQRRSQTAATLAGKIIGTPQYMAPEQIERPSDVDHRADIYALGVVFYQMLTGELPGKDLQAPSRKLQIDVRLDEIVLKALEKNPEQRYQQASVMRTRVETFAAVGRTSEGVFEREKLSGPNEPAVSWPKTAGWIAAAFVVTGVLWLFLRDGGKFYPGSSSRSNSAAVALRAYDWNDLAASGQAGDGVLVTVDGQTCLKIENSNDSALSARLLTIVTPPLKARRYAVMGEVRYENVQGMAYLEMWNEFPQGRFFSRTMDEPGSGAMGRLTGTSDWRPFILPFDQQRITSPPNRIEVNLHLPGRGVVIVGPLRLCELGTVEVADDRLEPRMPPVEVDATVLSITVSGEVRKPGTVRLKAPASLLDAFAAAGGWTENADLAGIRLRIPGEPEAQIIDLTAILRGEAVNPLVPPGAIVEIRAKRKP